MTYKLSPTSINLMLECPKCFWLQLVKKIKRPEGIFPSLPGGMGRIIKRHFDKFMERGELPPEIREYGLANSYKLFRIIFKRKPPRKFLKWLVVSSQKKQRN